MTMSQQNKEQRFQELLRFVRRHSPFYQELYARLPETIESIRQLPILDQSAFWKVNTLKDNKVLTGPIHDGIVFKSGGTTGNPKFSIFSRREWEQFNQIFGQGIASGVIEDGDRIVNLFYVGQLYGSFLFINKSLEKSPCETLQLPVGGSTSFDEVREIMQDFKANVIAGVPTTIMNLAEHVHQHRHEGQINVRKILFGGEAMYSDQRERLNEIFPAVTLQSIGYASTDAGLIGYADKSCGPNEHRSFGEHTFFEILDDETFEPINEVGREGLIVLTNLTRWLMPIIRYPVGDRGQWVEPRHMIDRKFLLQGRSEEAARVGLVKLYVEDVRKVLQPLRTELGISDFQMVVVHRERMDGLILRIATTADVAVLKKQSNRVIKEIHRARPLYEEFVRDQKIHPINVEWVKAGGLEVNPRTGKLKKVLDRRVHAESI